jgi:hypothetical protein
MPLTPLQFDLGINRETEEWMRRIYEFLCTRADAAYDLQELCTALEHSPHRPPSQVLRSALEELTYLGGVDARDIGGKIYYRHLDPIPEFG